MISAKRRAAILASLEAGNLITRHWQGPDQSGYLAHRLLGVPKLREAEVNDLRVEGVLRVLSFGERTKLGLHGAYAPLGLAR